MILFKKFRKRSISAKEEPDAKVLLGALTVAVADARK
jgi:hypothetical protein